MAVILNIETATKACSVSLAKDGKILTAQEVTEDKFSHAEKLHLFIDYVVRKANITFADIDAIAVGMGPGSYTGLRIGVSTAKGLAFAKSIPLIALSTLETLTQPLLKKFPDIEYFCPMLDARRMEVYSAVYDREMNTIETVEAIIIDDQFRNKQLQQNTVLFFGDGSDKLKTLIQDTASEGQHDNYHFVGERYPSAIDMAIISERKFNEKDFVDTAYFEPFYLKDFVAGKPKKLI